MSTVKDLFEAVAPHGVEEDLVSADPASIAGAATGRLYGFSMENQPLLAGLSALPHEVIPARTTVRLANEQIGAAVVVLFEAGDARRPIIVGVLHEKASPAVSPSQAPWVSVRVDEDRLVLSAEREIALQCGQASITLTRDGKIVIKGAYILSRSAGYNRIKGAAVDIN